MGEGGKRAESGSKTAASKLKREKRGQKSAFSVQDMLINQQKKGPRLFPFVI